MMRLITKERIFRVSVSGEPLEFLIDPYGAAVLIRKGSGVGDYDIPESAYDSVKPELPDNHTLRCTGYKRKVNYRVIFTPLVIAILAGLMYIAPIGVSMGFILLIAVLVVFEILKGIMKFIRACK